MLKSICAGIMIGIGGIVYLACPSRILGAFLFSIGLLTILHFKFNLFTGKAGLLATNQISATEIMIIWGGNAIGCFLTGFLTRITSMGKEIVEPAAAIVNTRITNNPFENIILGIFCGILMYVAVTSYNDKPYVTVMCVAVFILSGFNHCIADMFYCALGCYSHTLLQMVMAILMTTIGNIIGCVMIPWVCHNE